MNDKIYLDNNATTKSDEEVLNAMLPYLSKEYGNPSSTYSFGKEVKEEITKARKLVAELLNADESEIIFTSCASESNVTAIMNAVRNFPNKKHIITTKVEHASIIETMKYLESIGYKITYLSVDNLGRINIEELENSITDNTCLISIMMANNEIGNIYPIKEMAQIAKKNNILFHCDSVQAIGKIKIDVPYIIGLGKAVELILNDDYKLNEKLKELRNYMEVEIKKDIEDVIIYGDLENRLPNTSSIAFKGVKAEELLLILESFNIFVSTGSACNSEIAEPSHVLTACNADLKNYSPIRVSLGKYNTKEEIDIFIKRLINIINMIRKRG